MDMFTCVSCGMILPVSDRNRRVNPTDVGERCARCVPAGWYYCEAKGCNVHGPLNEVVHQVAEGYRCVAHCERYTCGSCGHQSIARGDIYDDGCVECVETFTCGIDQAIHPLDTAEQLWIGADRDPLLVCPTHHGQHAFCSTCNRVRYREQIAEIRDELTVCIVCGVTCRFCQRLSLPHDEHTGACVNCGDALATTLVPHVVIDSPTKVVA